MLPINKVEDLISRHVLLERELSLGSFDKKIFAEKSKEYSDLNEIIAEAKDYVLFKKNKNDLEKIINDTKSDIDIKKMAELEIEEEERKIRSE